MSIEITSRLKELRKAELHLHLEGAIQPATVCALTARHGVTTSEDEVRLQYNYNDFLGFLDAFKWVTSFLRDPADYALITHDLCEQLLEHHVVYAEVTLSVGVMPGKIYCKSSRGFRIRLSKCCRRTASDFTSSWRGNFSAARIFSTWDAEFTTRLRSKAR